MAKFLQSRVGSIAEDEILNQNLLSPALLRSLIAGDFHLARLGEDYVLLHEKGIFLLKQCHCNGIIHGMADGPVWTDMNYLGDGSDFPNPLWECRQAVERLSSMLKLPVSAFHSCVLFDVQCELRRVPENSARFTMMRVDQLEEFFARLPQLEARYSHTQLEALNDIFLLVSGQN